MKLCSGLSGPQSAPPIKLERLMLPVRSSAESWAGGTKSEVTQGIEKCRRHQARQQLASNNEGTMIHCIVFGFI